MQVQRAGFPEALALSAAGDLVKVCLANEELQRQVEWKTWTRGPPGLDLGTTGLV